MALQKYIHQLKPRQESNLLKKVDQITNLVLSEDKDSDVQAVIDAVEGCKIAEAVYE